MLENAGEVMPCKRKGERLLESVVQAAGTPIANGFQNCPCAQSWKA